MADVVELVPLYTLEVADKPVLIFVVDPELGGSPLEKVFAELREVSISEDFTTFVWDGKAELHARPASEEEKAVWRATNAKLSGTATPPSWMGGYFADWVFLVSFYDEEDGEWYPAGTPFLG